MAASRRSDLRTGSQLAADGTRKDTRMILDTALLERERAGRPVRVGMVGAGATGRAIALQLATPAPGIRLAAIANRTPEHAERAFREAGITGWQHAGSAREAEAAIAAGVPVLTEDPFALTACDA